MCAECWAGWFRHFQKYTRCPKSTNQPHINMTHSCQQHPILPFFQGPLALPITDGATENTSGQCSAPPSRLLQEEKEEAGVIAVGPVARLPAVQETLMSARGHAWCPILATEEGQGQSCLLRGCLFRGLFNQVGPVWWDLVGQGRMARDWSLIRLLSSCFSLLGWGLGAGRRAESMHS